MIVPKPQRKPERPFFSSGPCVKRPGWSPDSLRQALVGRSHRSGDGRQRLRLAIEKTRALLRLPEGYQIAIVPGSDTGAFEIAMWNLLGCRGADVFAWDAFGRHWLRDALQELKLPDVRAFDAEWGALPDLALADFSRDVIFTWNGTTSGVRVPDAEWIASSRQGLTFCDATSALFTEHIKFEKIDVLTFSWQKTVGGEAAHGMVVLSPRAIERLSTYRPAWPVPRLFRLTNNDGILPGLFEGVTINTPSMLCVEDYLDALDWLERIGGLDGALSRCRSNAALVYSWIEKTPWAAPLASDPATRSQTPVCVRLIDPEMTSNDNQRALHVMREMCDLLEHERAAFDIASYRGVPPGLRIWTGVTVETADVAALLPWLDWAYSVVKSRAAHERV